MRKQARAFSIVQFVKNYVIKTSMKPSMKQVTPLCVATKTLVGLRLPYQEMEKTRRQNKLEPASLKRQSN